MSVEDMIMELRDKETNPPTMKWREEIADQLEELARAARNRDMWKGQSERQAETLSEIRWALHDMCRMIAARPDMANLMGFGEKAVYERARKLLNP